VQVEEGSISLEDARDGVRHYLHQLHPAIFAEGAVGTSVAAVARHLLKPSETVTSSQVQCTECDYEGPEVDDKLDFVVCADKNTKGSTSKWMGKIQEKSRQRCPTCSKRKLTSSIHYDEVPKLLVLEYPNIDLKTSHHLTYRVGGEDTVLHLRGIIYHGGYHFTSRIMSTEGDIWYHDGINTGEHCREDGNLMFKSNNDLKQCLNRKLVLAI
jgi:hypothetical protein